MKYANINENNKILGWYDDLVHKNIPTPNIEITDDVWRNAINNNHNKVNSDGTTELFDFRTDDELIEIENQNILSQIAAKEKEQYRPMRELLSTSTTTEDKEYAQTKIDTLEAEIQALRSQLK